MNTGSDVSNKAVVLHLYGNSAEAVASCTSVAAFYGEVGSLVKYKHRDLVVETTTAFIKFSIYRKDLPSNQQDGICGQYSHIYFHVELPEQVKQHFLSRIRLYGVEYAEPS